MNRQQETIIDEKAMKILAALSAVDFPGDESDLLRADLQKIIGYVERLKELDIEETVSRLETEKSVTPGVPDLPVPGLARGEAFRNAPETQGSFFKAPPIIERLD